MSVDVLIQKLTLCSAGTCSGKNCPGRDDGAECVEKCMKEAKKTIEQLLSDFEKALRHPMYACNYCAKKEKCNKSGARCKPVWRGIQP